MTYIIFLWNKSKEGDLYNWLQIILNQNRITGPLEEIRGFFDLL